jgi:hypothetical protein
MKFFFNREDAFYVCETKYYPKDTGKVGVAVTFPTCIWDIPGLTQSGYQSSCPRSSWFS